MSNFLRRLEQEETLQNLDSKRHRTLPQAPAMCVGKGWRLFGQPHAITREAGQAHAHSAFIAAMHWLVVRLGFNRLGSARGQTRVGSGLNFGSKIGQIRSTVLASQLVESIWTGSNGLSWVGLIAEVGLGQFMSSSSYPLYIIKPLL